MEAPSPPLLISFRLGAVGPRGRGGPRGGGGERPANGRMEGGTVYDAHHVAAAVPLPSRRCSIPDRRASGRECRPGRAEGAFVTLP